MNSESDPFSARKRLAGKTHRQDSRLGAFLGNGSDHHIFSNGIHSGEHFSKRSGFLLWRLRRRIATQFEGGARFLSVETCLPMKILAGQIKDLVDRGQKTIFHPSILNTQPCAAGDKATEYCPYIQSSAQFFKGTFDVEWFEFIIGFSLDHAAFRRDHLNLARGLGISKREATVALNSGLEQLANFQKSLRNEGERFLKFFGL